MKTTKKILELLLEKLPIPQEIRGTHYIMLKDGKLNIGLWLSPDILQNIICTDDELDKTPEEFVNTILEFLKQNNLI